MIIERAGKYFALLLALSLVSGAGCHKKEDAKAAGGIGFVDYDAMRADVIKQVQAGQIVPDANGIADLPPQFEQVSPDKKIYITKSDTGLLVVFRTVANSSFGHGLLYCDKPPAPKIRVGPFNLTTRSKINEHWYQVTE